ncbi:MAG TPA: TIGR01777 family oxidoreductase [Ignavibacteria bacterium]|jgi:hypothetical protein
MARNILITGATGLIGTCLVKTILKRGDNVAVLSTNVKSASKYLPEAGKIISWNDYLSLVNENIDIVINLAGKNIGETRWNDKFKKEIYDSRILSTRKIVDLIGKMTKKPGALINASGVDYYGNRPACRTSRGDENIYEDAKPGNDFMARLCVDWEAEAKKAENFGVRVVLIRTGFVLAKNSPAVNMLTLPFKLFIGGTIGSGKQYMSWIHIDDVVKVYLFSADNNNITGPVNAAAPNPERMKNFCRIIAKVLHRPAIIPAPEFAVKLIAGEAAQLVLNGRKALPKKILEAGYKFSFANAPAAWSNILE